MIVLLSGKMGSGKSTLADSLCKEYGARHLKFADPLYEMQEAIREVCKRHGIPFEKKEGRLLQLLGTDFGREVKGHDVWVNAAKYRAGMIQSQDPAMMIIIDDARFKNEIDGFPEAFKIRLRCSRDVRKERADAWRDTEDHISETDLDEYDQMPEKFNLILNTGGTTKDQTLSDAILAINRFYFKQQSTKESGAV